MRYRKLGRTDLDVSVLGSGASPLSSVFSVTDPAEGLRALYRAIDCGINFFDVSPDYGATLAKMRLGEALAGRRDAVIVATKCGRCGAAGCDFSAERVTCGVNHFLERQTEYVDLLQVHDVEFGSVHQIVDETLSALRVLQQAGKVRYIGITGFSLKTLAAILERAEADTVLSYCRYKLMVDDMDAALTPLVRARRIGLINASTLHMGILSPSAAACLAPCAGGVAGGCCARAVGMRGAWLRPDRAGGAALLPSTRLCVEHVARHIECQGAETKPARSRNGERRRGAGRDRRGYRGRP